MRKIRLFAFTREALKNMVSRPATINYPDEPAVYPQRMRGHIRIDISQCISCTLCAQNCPPRAIQVDRDAGTWTIDRFDCVQCGSCVNVCPKHCLYMEQGYTPPETKKHTETFARPKQERKLPQADEDCVFCGCAPANVRSRPSRSAAPISNGKWTNRSAWAADYAPMPARRPASS